MSDAHDRRVAALAALFGSDSDGHVRSNRNLTELWSQFDAQRRGALELSEFRSCISFLASRRSGQEELSSADLALVWSQLEREDEVAPAGQVSIPSLVVFVRSALMAQHSRHRGTLDGSPAGSGGGSPARHRPQRARPARRPRRSSGRSSDGIPHSPPQVDGDYKKGGVSWGRSPGAAISGTARRTSFGGGSRGSPPRSAGSARPRSPSPTASRRSSAGSASSPGRRPPSPNVGSYDVVRRARVRAACETDSLELGYLEPGQRAEVIETRQTRPGHLRVKVLFERGVVDWTGQRRVGWTSISRPSGAKLLIPAAGSRGARGASPPLELSARLDSPTQAWVSRLTTDSAQQQPRGAGGTPASGPSATPQRSRCAPVRKSSTLPCPS